MIVLTVVFLFLLIAVSASKHTTRPVDAITVFSQGEGGYYCHKIPYLYRTNQGTLLAFAEGRGRDGRASCDDFAVRIWKNYLCSFIRI